MSNIIKVNLGPGIKNYGNTCFINVALQCLLSNPTISNLLNNIQINSRQMSLLKHIKNLSLEYNDPNHNQKVIYPEKFVKLFLKKYPLFIEGQQQDSQEFLVVLNNFFEEDFKNNNIIFLDNNLQDRNLNNLLKLKMCDKKECQICKGVTSINTLSYQLDVQIPPEVNSVIEAFSNYEIMEGINCVYCDICQQRTIQKKEIIITELPKILIINLKRNQFSIETLMPSKIKRHITFEMTLQLIENDLVVNYNLVAVVVHLGETI